MDEYAANNEGVLTWKASTFPNMPWGKLLETKAKPFECDYKTALSPTQVGTMAVIKRLNDKWIIVAEMHSRPWNWQSWEPWSFYHPSPLSSLVPTTFLTRFSFAHAR